MASRGEQSVAGDAETGLRLFHAGHGLSNVLIAGQRFLDEGVQSRIVEAFPPFALQSLRLRSFPRLRDLQFGALVVGSETAAGTQSQDQGRSDKGHYLTHTKTPVPLGKDREG